MKKSVWKVTGYNIDDGMENLFEAYFTDRDVAHAVYHKGEREYGIARSEEHTSELQSTLESRMPSSA